MRTFKAALFSGFLLLPCLAAGEEPSKLEGAVVTGNTHRSSLKVLYLTVT